MKTTISKIDLALDTLNLSVIPGFYEYFDSELLEISKKLFSRYHNIKTSSIFTESDKPKTINVDNKICSTYRDLIGNIRKGIKLGEGNYYVDSELNIPVAASNQYDNTLDISDFTGERDIYIMSNGKPVIGYKHSTKDNLVLEPVDNVVHDLDSSSIIYEF